MNHELQINQLRVQNQTFQIRPYFRAALQEPANVLAVIAVESVAASLADPQLAVAATGAHRVRLHVVGDGGGRARGRWTDVVAADRTPGQDLVFVLPGLQGLAALLGGPVGGLQAELVTGPGPSSDISDEELALGTFLPGFQCL